MEEEGREVRVVGRHAVGEHKILILSCSLSKGNHLILTYVLVYKSCSSFQVSCQQFANDPEPSPTLPVSGQCHHLPQYLCEIVIHNHCKRKPVCLENLVL